MPWIGINAYWSNQQDLELKMLQHPMGVLSISQATYKCWWFRNLEKTPPLVVHMGHSWGLPGCNGRWLGIGNYLARVTGESTLWWFRRGKLGAIEVYLLMVQKPCKPCVTILQYTYTYIYSLYIYTYAPLFCHNTLHLYTLDMHKHVNLQDSPCQLVSRISEASTVSSGLEFKDEHLRHFVAVEWTLV